MFITYIIPRVAPSGYLHCVFIWICLSRVYLCVRPISQAVAQAVCQCVKFAIKKVVCCRLYLSGLLLFSHFLCTDQFPCLDSNNGGFVPHRKCSASILWMFLIKTKLNPCTNLTVKPAVNPCRVVCLSEVCQIVCERHLVAVSRQSSCLAGWRWQMSILRGMSNLNAIKSQLDMTKILRTNGNTTHLLIYKPYF